MKTYEITAVVDTSVEAQVDREMSQDFDDYAGCQSMIEHLNVERLRRVTALAELALVGVAEPQPKAYVAPAPTQMVNLGNGVWVEQPLKTNNSFVFTLGMHLPTTEAWSAGDDLSLLQHLVTLEEVSNLV
jgi:hypothetical protein